MRDEDRLADLDPGGIRDPIPARQLLVRYAVRLPIR